MQGYAYQQSMEINEQMLYSDISQGDKSFKFFNMNVSNRFFTGTQSLVFKIIQTSYDSDPDIFISKINQYPQSANDAQWYCMKSGSDTCVVRNTDVNFGDKFYIGVRCINPCKYNMRAQYVDNISITEATRTQIRMDGQSSGIFQYFVPSDASDGFTQSVILTVESENPYSPIDIFLSIDKDLYQIEERKNQLSIQNGQAYRFTSNDPDWCTKCYIYLLVDVIDQGRYYITGKASSNSDVLTNAKQVTRVSNPRFQDCLQYYVEKNSNDLQIISQQFEGNSEIYVSGRTKPQSINDNSVQMISERSPWRTLIVTSKDRTRFGQQTGLYYICIFPYLDTSMRLQINEANQNSRYDAVDGMLYTFNLESNGYLYFRYTSKDLTKKITINLELNAFNLPSNSLPPRIFYKVCKSSNPPDCYLEDTEAQGKSGMKEIVGYSGSSRIGSISHNPADCQNVNSCFYLVSCYYPNNGPQKASFKISSDPEDPQDAQLEVSYRNIMRQDSYFFYELLPGSSIGRDFTDSIIIDLISYNGDADLFISSYPGSNPPEYIRQPTKYNYQYSSQNVGGAYDRIILNNTVNFTLDDPIYIAVYSFVETAYQLTITPVYSPTYNEKLETAEPLSDSVASYKYFETEYNEAFYSFYPWWPSHENRTMVFFGDVIFNKIYFYAQVNDYPWSFFSDLVDNNDVIAITPNHPIYDRKGQYYIRVRPDFQLQDLVSKRQYIFNFYAFSQLPDNTYTDLPVGETILGYCNNTLKHYRHFIISKNDTYKISIKPKQGKPVLYVKFSNTPVIIDKNNIYSYDVKFETNGDFAEFSLSAANRTRYNFDCDKAGFSQGFGNQQCTIYYGIGCDEQCIYNVSFSMMQSNNNPVKSIPPQYLMDNEYAMSKVQYNETKYFYYPIHPNNTGEMAIILNKTGPLQKNGDTLIMMRLQNDTSLIYHNWTYPNLSNYHTISISNQSTQTELIEFCDTTFQKRCVNTSCVLLIGVMGLDKTKASQFRLSVFSRRNKLYDKQPVSGIIQKAGDYQYFWFISNATVNNSNAPWQYVIGTSADKEGSDVDLYVSVMDGRLPKIDDYDWFSNNVGPDDIFISNKDFFFEDNAWNTALGMMFVVGVRALTDNTQFSLMMSGPKKYQLEIIDLKTSVAQTNFFNNNTLNETHMHIYKWYNWGSKDFKISVQCQGQVQVLFNYMGETNYQNNAFLAVPFNSNNTKLAAIVNTEKSLELQIFKTDINTGFFCYYCIYYITILQNSTQQNSTYRIAIDEMIDRGDDIPQVNIGEPNSLQLPSTGAVVQRKFILDEKSPFTISITIETGTVIAYVGLYPENVLTKYAWTNEGSIGTFQIPVRTTDPNFHLGTYYYVTLQSKSGRAKLSLRITQSRDIVQLDNAVIRKDLFWTIEERVKLYYFKVPASNFTATINIIALSEDFYPQLYFYKNSLTQVPNDFTTLTYPTMIQYTKKVGDNFIDLINQRNFSFSINGSETNQYTYYTMALYAFSYGMTDRRKAQFTLNLQITNTAQLTLSEINIFELDDEQKESIFLNEERNIENSWLKQIYELYREKARSFINTFFQL